VLRVIADRDPDVPVAVANAIGGLRAPQRGIAALLWAITDPNRHVERRAAPQIPALPPFIIADSIEDEHAAMTYKLRLAADEEAEIRASAIKGLDFLLLSMSHR
jgi:hypothetical protein